ncbi:MAG TPA: hypothetical protein VHE30_12155 [Polyangiaceae bacterium]|nr:hypothetical protein [Polyangiaceae bacterium]
MRTVALLGGLMPLVVACSSSDDAGKSPGGSASGDSGVPSGSGGEGSGGATAGGGQNATSGGAKGSGGSSGSSGSGGAAGKVTLSYRCDDAPPDVVAPPSTWANATGNLAGMASECGNLGLVSANPCSTLVIAGVAKAGLWGTEDGGKNWVKLGSGAGSAEITNRISAVVYDPEHPGTFWESGIYNGGGVYKTADDGKTFEQLGDVTHTDSVSVDFTDPERKTLLAGPHETNSRVWRSSDGGKTWEDIGKSLPGDAGYCTATQVLGAANLLVGCNNGGVFHSTGGDSWTPLGSKGVIPQPFLATDGAIYWPGSSGGLSVSTDSGAHFDEVVDGNTAPGIVGSWSPAELPDGRIVIVGKDHLLLSSDHGRNWKPIGEPLPYPGGGYDGARGPAYSARTKTFYIWRWDCGNSVLPDAIMSAGFDYTLE